MLKTAIQRMSHVFSQETLLRGKQYQINDHVLTTRLSDGLLKGNVKGHANQIYDVFLNLRTWPEEPARCSCPSHINCKHAVAMLFALQEKEKINLAATENLLLLNWIDSLQALEKKIITQSLYVFYVFNHNRDEPYFIEEHESETQNLTVMLWGAKALKKGGLGKKSIINSLTKARREALTPEDEAILANLLFNATHRDWFHELQINQSSVFEKILETGRAMFFEQDEEEDDDHQEEHVLSLLPTVSAELKWRLNHKGEQRLTLDFEGKKEKILYHLEDGFWYFDPVLRGYGRIETTYSAKKLKTILQAPPVPIKQAETIALSLQEAHPGLPLPRVYQKLEKRLGTPKLVLGFDMLKSDYSDQLFTVIYSFEYADELIIEKSDPMKRFFVEEGETLVELQRNIKAEKAYYEEAQAFLSSAPPSVRQRIDADGLFGPSEEVLKDFSDESALPRLHQDIFPKLRAKGWIINLYHTIYQEIISEQEIEWISDIQEASHDFFSYQLGIAVHGETVNIVPLVVGLLKQHGSKHFEDISDNTQLRLMISADKTIAISMKRIKPLIRFILQFGTKKIQEDGTIQLNRYQLLLMQETEKAIVATKLRWQGSATIRKQLKQLITQKDLPSAEVPNGLQATLRPYQHHGLDWLQFLRKSRFSGILADDMGLGKTVQTLAHLLLEKEQGRLSQASLIIAPTSLMGNWFEEAQRFVPNLRVLIFHGGDRHHETFDDYDLIVSTYGLIQRDKTRFVEYPFYYLILDEAQFIKNSRTKTTQIIQQLQATHRLCLTGTPLENHLGELWSLFHFLMPGLLGDSKQFRQYFKTPIEREGDNDRRKQLANRVRPFMLRRTKNEVAKELPPKTEIIRTVTLENEQRDLYEAVRMTMEKKVLEAIAKQGLAKSHIVFLDALLKLRQVCCDPRLVNLEQAKMAHGHSAKLEALMELLDNLLAEGRRVLIFSQFTSMLDLISESLRARQYEFLKLTGQTINRQKLVHDFQEGNVPIFLISLKAGGTGLNLTRADTVIHYDPWWNPAAEDQATDRSHRIGQENPVFVYKLISSGTVEEAILSMQSKKRQLVDGILNEQKGQMAQLTVNEVEEFFKPIEV